VSSGQKDKRIYILKGRWGWSNKGGQVTGLQI
jgi:hypothetical protein